MENKDILVMENIKFEFTYTDGSEDSITVNGCPPEFVEQMEDQIQSPKYTFIEILDNFYRKESIRKVSINKVD